MGKSRKIQDLSEVNKDFSSYMEELEAEMKACAGKYQEELTEQMKSFYGDDTTTIQIEGKSHNDYQIEMEFSLDNIQKIIVNTTEQLFASSSAGGEEQEKEKIMEALDNYKESALHIAVNFVSGILASLCFTRASSYSYDTQHVSVGPGLTLHMLVVERYYDGKGFFEKKHIIQNFIEYRLVFSKKIAARQMDIEYITNKMRDYEEDSETYRRLKKERTALILSTAYVEESAGGELHELAANYKALLDDLTESRQEAYDAVKRLCEPEQNKMLRSASPQALSLDDALEVEKRRKEKLHRINAPLAAYLKER